MEDGGYGYLAVSLSAALGNCTVLVLLPRADAGEMAGCLYVGFLIIGRK